MTKRTAGWEAKKTRKATMTPTVLDIAWAAGFFEGEGSYQRVGDRNGSGSLWAAQVNKEPLTRLQKMFGGSLVRKFPKKGEHRQPIWFWRVYGPRSRGVAMTIYAFLSKKRKAQVRKTI